MHSPLTGIFLIAELTGGYQLFMPLMIVCISSLLTISIFESHSIYALRLAREGKLLTHHVDRSALTLMSMQSMVEKDYHVNLVYLRRIFRTFLSDIPSKIVKHTMMPDKSQDKPIIKLKQNANELSRL